MVPSSSVALARLISAHDSLPSARAARYEALTLAASSTPAGTRWVSRSSRYCASPSGGFFSSSIRSAVCWAERGSGGIPSAARSATCWRYVSSMAGLRKVGLREGLSAGIVEGGGGWGQVSYILYKTCRPPPISRRAGLHGASRGRRLRPPARRRHTMRAQPDIAMHYFRRRYSTPNPYLDHDPF